MLTHLIGGAIASLVYREMLSTIGLRKSLAIFTAIDAVSFTVGYLMMEERRPASKRSAIVWYDRAFFRDPVFWSLALCFFFTVLCVLLHFTYTDIRSYLTYLRPFPAVTWGPSSSSRRSRSRRLPD